MRTKCHSCLCWTCLNTCCNRKNCSGKKDICENYSGFRQLSVFEPSPNPQYRSVPRHSLEYYGITKERYRELIKYIQSDRYAVLASQAAHSANETIAEYLIISIAQNKSYDALKVKWELKEMEQIPYCRTDFYGIRSYTIYLFDLEMRKIGK